MSAEEATSAPLPEIGAPDFGAPVTGWLPRLLTTLRQRLALVAGCVAIALLAAILYLRSADYSYAVMLRVAPAQSAAAARESGNLSALGNLASLTGIAIPSVPATPFRLYTEGLYTREVADRLARDPDLLKGLFPDQWDAGSGTWRSPDTVADGLLAGANAIAGAPATPWSQPDGAAVQRRILRDVRLDQSPKTPVSVISIDAVDPAFGIRFLTILHQTVDDYLREKALARNVQNIAYLNQKLKIVSVADHRQALIATLADQEQRLMLTKNPSAYAAEPFGTITVSPLPTKPRPYLVVAIALALGAIAGIILALLLPPRRTAPAP